MWLRSIACTFLALLFTLSLAGKAIYFEIDNKASYSTEKLKTLEDDVIFCDSWSNNPWSDYITGVTLGSINNDPQVSPKTDNIGLEGYVDFTSFSTDLTIGQSSLLTVENFLSWWGNGSCPAYLYVWIDLNGDDDFLDSGENVITSSISVPNNGSTPTISENITIPATATVGTTRMRIILKNIYSQNTADDIPPGPCDNSFRGEVEDYAVNLIGGAPDTTPPVPTLDGPASTSGPYDITLNFDEPLTTPPPTISASDFNVTSNNATVSNVVVLTAGVKYSATVTPNPGISVNDNISVVLNANVVQDVALNWNAESLPHTCTYSLPNLSFSFSTTDETAPDNNDGTITVENISGSTSSNPVYTYSWNPTQTNSGTLINLAPGTYALTVTDDLGATGTSSTTVGTQNSSNGVDLEVTITVDNNAPEIYQNRVYTITLNNSGSQASSGVELLIPIPGGELAYQSHSATVGIYTNGTTNIWTVGALAAGSSAILTLNLFTLSATPTLYAQVNAMNETDTDSTPGNGTPPTVNEDDEAANTLGAPDPINISPTVTDATSSTATDGRINLDVTGGTPAYTFAWSTGATTQNLIDITVGTYSVTVTDQNGDTASETNISVTAPPGAQLALTLTPTNPTSPLAADGLVSSNVSGGTSPYYYIWSNGETTTTISDLPLGYYGLTVTDNVGTTVSAGTDLVFPTDPLTVDLVATNATGPTAGDGEVTPLVSGGWEPYTYQWSNGAQSQYINSLVPGMYAVTVSDAIGNVVTEMATVGIGTDPIVLGGLVMDETGPGVGDGRVDLTVDGGVEPYLFLWSNGAITQNLINVYGSVYTVTVSDTYGNTATGSYTVNTTNNGGPSTCTTTQNLSVGKDANQSSVQVANSLTPDEDADRAIDGETSIVWNPISFSKTNWESNSNAWWEIDLGANYQLEEVKVWNVEGGDAVHLANYYLFVSETPFTSDDPTVLLNDPTVWNVFNASQALRPSTLAVGTTGQYVRIQLQGNAFVSLAEVEVMGCAIVPGTSLVVKHTVVPASNNTEEDGAIDLSVFGGTAPYTFAWSNAETTEDLVMLGSGNYDVTVTDATATSTTLSVNMPVENMFPEGIYHSLSKKLDGGFVVTNTENLRFKYLENYQPDPGEQVSYKIIGKTGILPIPGTADLLNVLTATTNHEYGVNLYLLDLTLFNIDYNEVYTLVVEEGNKKEKHFLRFKTQCSIECLGQQ